MNKSGKIWQCVKMFAVIFFTMAAGAACYRQYMVMHDRGVEITVVDKPHAEYIIREVQPEAVNSPAESEAKVHVLESEDVEEDSNEETEDGNRPFKMYTTAYCEGEITATGAKVRRGICAVRKEWLGLTAEVYECDQNGNMGELLGYWECLDTGFGGDADGDGVGSIENGRVIRIVCLYIINCFVISFFLYIFGLLSVEKVLGFAYVLLVIELLFLAWFVFHIYDRIF